MAEGLCGSGKQTIQRPFFLSLRTHFLRDAKILGHRLTEMSDLIFAADAKKVMAIAPEIQVRMLNGIFSFEIGGFELRRVSSQDRPKGACSFWLLHPTRPD